MTKPSGIMQFVSRVPWDSDDPDISFVLDALISKGVDFVDGETHVRIYRCVDPAETVWYHVDTTTAGVRTTKHTFLLENQRSAIEYFVVECDRVADSAKAQNL